MKKVFVIYRSFGYESSVAGMATTLEVAFEIIQNLKATNNVFGYFVEEEEVAETAEEFR